MTFTKQQLEWLIAGLESVIADTQYMIDLPAGYSENPEQWQRDKQEQVALKERLEKEGKGWQ